MAITTTFTVSFTTDSKALAKALTALAKLGIAPTVTTDAIAKAEQPKKVYDETTCTKVLMGKLTDALNPLRGTGMIERVKATFGIDYSLASTLVSAESASKKDKRDYLLVVPAKAEAVKAIIAKLEPKVVLVKKA